MVFSSVTFLFYFLPIFLFFYFLLPFKNTVLLIASLFFYSWGEAGYTIILVISILLNYIIGLFIGKYLNNPNQKLCSLGVGIFLNLLLIGYFKYFYFLTSKMLGLEVVDSIHLPLGISFFTFQAISYLVDVSRNEADVEKNPFNLALYISMFPQLIAGPIVRFKSVARQINNRRSSFGDINKGVRIFIVGLAQKILIANTLAVPTDEIFSMDEATLTTFYAWLGTLTYTLQIYFDFAGYSNMAIGLGLILGFRFPQNFNFPYVSQSITEFWQRWHMSLSTWFRDYLYIPLGGNRISPIRTYINLMLVFILCGLWHGAAWTFVVWGIYHGLFLILERFKIGLLLKKTWQPLRHIYTLLVVMVGWVVFRAEDFSQFSFYVKSMLGFSKAVDNMSYMVNNTTNLIITTIIFGVIFSFPIYLYIQNIMTKYINSTTFKYSICFGICLEICYLVMFILSLLSVASGSYNPFIYFRF